MKELYVSVERRYKFYCGKFYVQGIENVDFFVRYLNSFKKVYVIARVEKVSSEPVDHQLFDHRSIIIIPIFTKRTGITNVIRLINVINIIKRSYSCVILRTPGFLSYTLSIYMILFNQRFSLEVVTNPLEEASHLTNNKFIRYSLIKVFLFVFKVQLKRCAYASFVTRCEIQNEFLSSKEIVTDKFNSSYSSIVLDNDDFINQELLNNRRLRLLNNEKICLLFIGVLDRPFKGLDVFINLVARLPDKYSAIVVGDGLLLNSYKKMAIDLNVCNRIDFVGFLSDKSSKKEVMSSADIFVLCSRREGLPRVVIEAMAWGLPCFCSNVSGVSELVEQLYIFPVEDVESAIRIICEKKPDTLILNSNRNLEESQQYNNSILYNRRENFYQKVGYSESFTPK